LLALTAAFSRNWRVSPTRRPCLPHKRALEQHAIAGKRKRVHQRAEAGRSKVRTPEGHLGKIDAVDASHLDRLPTILKLHRAFEFADARGGFDFRDVQMLGDGDKHPLWSGNFCD
jgi:hypothetical protein